MPNGESFIEVSLSGKSILVIVLANITRRRAPLLTIKLRGILYSVFRLTGHTDNH